MTDRRRAPITSISLDAGETEKFWSNVAKTAHCWTWTGARHNTGYGLFRTEGRRLYAHRVSYLLAHGAIAHGLEVDHLCHGWADSCAEGDGCPHRLCVNPDHLEAVTTRVNNLRGRGFAAVAAKRTHCPQGHPYDETNTVVLADGKRRCRICRAESEARSLLRRQRQRRLARLRRMADEETSR
jgi:hypothetical protein